MTLEKFNAELENIPNLVNDLKLRAEKELTGIYRSNALRIIETMQSIISDGSYFKFTTQPNGNIHVYFDTVNIYLMYMTCKRCKTFKDSTKSMHFHVRALCALLNEISPKIKFLGFSCVDYYPGKDPLLFSIDWTI